MNRRPRLLVFLAFFYLLSPMIYPIFVSLRFGDPIAEVLRQLYSTNTPIRNFEVFIFPILLASCIFFARRFGYFVVLISAGYLFVRNLVVFYGSNESLPAPLLVTANLAFVCVIIYFSRRSTRMIYFNAKLRWWETDPRYQVEYPGSLTRVGREPMPIRIKNIAIGGAAIETTENAFFPEELVHIEFKAEGAPYRLAAGAVWEQSPAASTRMVGIHWIDDPSNPDTGKVKKLIQDLKSKRTPTTSQAPSWWHELNAWISHSK